MQIIIWGADQQVTAVNVPLLNLPIPSLTEMVQIQQQVADDAQAAADSAAAVAGMQGDIDQAVEDSSSAIVTATAADAKATEAQAVIDSQVTPAQLRKNTLDATRAPLPSDDETQGYAVGSRWLWQGQEWVATEVGAGAAVWSPSARSAFASREDAEATRIPPPVTIINVAGLQYALDPAGTALTTADGKKWSPLGDVYPDHFAENTNPGVTDMAPAFAAAFAWTNTVRLRAATYGIGSTVILNSKRLIGQHSEGAKRSRLLGLSAVLPVGDAIIAPGRTSTVENIRIEYDALTGSEGPNERVGMNLTGATYALQRGSWINAIQFNHVGTAVSDFGGPNGGPFSVSFGVIEVMWFSYAGIYLTSRSRTGNDFGNWYIGASGDVYTPTYGVYLGGREAGGNFRQLNIEHTIFVGPSLYCTGQRGMNIETLHLEGTDTASAGVPRIFMQESSVRIGSLNVFHMRASYDNVPVIELGDAGFDSLGSYAGSSTTGYLSIGTIYVKGLANPHAPLYPSYPAGRRGLNNVAGFALIKRTVGHPNADYAVDVSDYQWATYAGMVDADIYREPVFSRLLVSRFGFMPEQTASAFAPYSASITPYLNSGHVMVGPLTGNIAIQNPVTFPRTGAELSFGFVQDATGGRSVSFGNKFIGSPASSGTAGQRRIVKFRWDGAFYIRLSDSGWVG